jgi:hypothetical protein
LRAAGRGRLHFLRRRVTDARGCGRHLDASTFLLDGAPALPGGLHGCGTCMQRRARWDGESLGHDGCVASVGATARVWRMGWRRDGGGGGRWNGVGRGRWGAGGRVHRRNCAGGRTEARIGRWGGEAQGEVSARVSSRVRRAMPGAASGAQSLALGIWQTDPRPKKFAAPRRTQCLLEGRFRGPKVQIGCLYSARPV